MPFGADLPHYKSRFNWPDVARSNTPSGFYCANEFSVYHEVAISRKNYCFQWRSKVMWEIISQQHFQCSVAVLELVGLKW